MSWSLDCFEEYIYLYSDHAVQLNVAEVKRRKVSSVGLKPLTI